VTSPYDGLPVGKWKAVTDRLLEEHPLSAEVLVTAVLSSWDQIFESTIGSLRIGRDIFPQPQTMGFFLHELIPVAVSSVVEGWSRGKTKMEKDLHCNADQHFSVEIKTSSNPRHVYGNRSYAQEPTQRSADKSGYYLAVNFEKFVSGSAKRPQILRVRFGWLDHSDWRGQAAATGQQASIRPEAYAHKLREVFSAADERDSD
jgi:hypothetical protein